MTKVIEVLEQRVKTMRKAAKDNLRELDTAEQRRAAYAREIEHRKQLAERIKTELRECQEQLAELNRLAAA